jgi:hypothetical protein
VGEADVVGFIQRRHQLAHLECRFGIQNRVRTLRDRSNPGLAQATQHPSALIVATAEDRNIAETNSPSVEMAHHLHHVIYELIATTGAKPKNDRIIVCPATECVTRNVGSNGSNGEVRDSGLGVVDGVVQVRSAEEVINPRHDPGCRTIVLSEVNQGPTRAEGVPHGEIGIHTSGTESVDSLLGVSHHDESSARSPPEHSFEDAPLEGVGILKLINHHYSIERTKLLSESIPVRTIETLAEITQYIREGLKPHATS